MFIRGSFTAFFRFIVPSDPQLAVERTVLNRFGDVVGMDGFSAVKVGNGAGDFQDSIVGAGTEI